MEVWPVLMATLFLKSLEKYRSISSFAFLSTRGALMARMKRSSASS